MARKREKLRGIYEDPKGSNIWWIQYFDSERKRHREKAGRREAAINLLAIRRTEKLEGRKLPAPRHAVLFRTLCADALEHARAENTAKSAYELDLRVKRLLPVFGDRPAEEITKQEIVRWLTEQVEKRRWKPASRNRWQAALSLIFRVGIDNEKITKNPAAGIKRKTENNGKVRFLSSAEELALLHETDAKFHPHLLLSIHTGVRMSEQYRLKWSQIDFERRQMYLPKTKNGDPRDVPLNQTALAALQQLRIATRGGEVFPDAESPRGWFLGAVERARLEKYSWHCNRHTFASRLVMAGVDLHTVGELLGHRTAQMTKRYAHLSLNHKQAAVERIVSEQSAIKTASDQMERPGIPGNML
jgi:site-specific recombinase XerD